MLATAEAYERMTGRESSMFAISVGIGTMFIGAHVSGVNAVFPRILGQLRTDMIQGQWILTAYTLALSACLILFGTLADRIGLERIYLIGLAVFGLSSAGCAVATGTIALIGMRIVEGVGGAMVSATSVALLGSRIPSNQLGRAMGWQAGMTYAGLALGPVAAGYLVQTFGWRVWFAVNVPAAALAIGAMMAAPAALGLAARRSEAAAFAGRARLQCKFQFITATASETIYYFCLYAAGFLLPLYLIHGRGFTLAHAGILLGSQSVARAVAAPLGGRLIDHVGARPLTVAGIFLLTIALYGMHAFDAGTSSASVAATLTVLGVGAGFFAPANSKALLDAAASGLYGVSTGLLATARNVGMTLGVAVAALLYSAFGGEAGGAATLTAVRIALAAIGGMAILCAAMQIHRPRWNLGVAGLDHSERL